MPNCNAQYIHVQFVDHISFKKIMNEIPWNTIVFLPFDMIYFMTIMVYDAYRDSI